MQKSDVEYDFDGLIKEEILSNSQSSKPLRGGTLSETMVQQGYWLFRWRSYLPMILIPLVILALLQGESITEQFGNGMGLLWDATSLLVAWSGLLLRIVIVGAVPKGTSGRNTKTQQANSLNRTGPYSLVRHPIYVANFVVFLGIMMLAQSMWLVLIASFAYWLYYERIICAEEDFLAKKFGAVFTEWASETNTLIPRNLRWVPSELNFSLKNAISREYSTMFLIVSATAVLFWVRRFHGGGTSFPLTATISYFFIGVILYLSLHIVKKRTNWLYAAGRN